MNNLLLAFAKWFLRTTINILAYVHPGLSARLTFALFKKPRSKKLTPEQYTYLKQATKEQIRLDEDFITVYHWPGGGPRILLIHGWESHSYRWKAYVSALRRPGFDIYALDAPGHGLSGGKDFTPLRYAAAIDVVVRKWNIRLLLSHSVGAYATIIYMSHYPSAAGLNYVILKAPTSGIKKTSAEFFRILGLNRRAQQVFLRYLAEMTGQDPEYYESRRMLSQVNIPGLLIHDANDNILDVEDSRNLAHAWQGGEYMETRGYGHRLNTSDVIRIILDKLTPFLNNRGQ